MHISAALFDNPRNLYATQYILLILTVEYVNLIQSYACKWALLRSAPPKTFHELRVEIQFVIVLVHVMYDGIRMPKYVNVMASSTIFLRWFSIAKKELTR